jgi:DNA-binding XRE family transcriptional regulator
MSIMKEENNNKDITTWAQIKDQVYGEKGSERRDNLDREAESFKIGLLLKKARESRHMTQEELGQIIDKKRTYISRVENDGSNITLSTLFDIVEKGLGGKVRISIDI